MAVNDSIHAWLVNDNNTRIIPNTYSTSVYVNDESSATEVTLAKYLEQNFGNLESSLENLQTDTIKSSDGSKLTVANSSSVNDVLLQAIPRTSSKGAHITVAGSDKKIKIRWDNGSDSNMDELYSKNNPQPNVPTVKHSSNAATLAMDSTGQLVYTGVNGNLKLKAPTTKTNEVAVSINNTDQTISFGGGGVNATQLGGQAANLHIRRSSAADSFGGTKLVSVNTNGVISNSSSSVGSGVEAICLKEGTLGVIGAAGSGSKPVYVNSSGKIVACGDTVGSTTRPVYLNGGQITACGTSVGSASQPMYINGNGNFAASTATFGAANKPIYMKDGTFTVCSGTYGSASQPIYINGGVFTACTNTLKVVSFSDGVLKIASSNQ